MAAKERYIIDTDGNRVGVVLDIAEYEELLAEPLIEEADYEVGRVEGQPWEQAKRELGLASGV